MKMEQCKQAPIQETFGFMIADQESPESDAISCMAPKSVVGLSDLEGMNEVANKDAEMRKAVMRKDVDENISSKTFAKSEKVMNAEKTTQVPTPENLDVMPPDQAMPETSTSSGAAPNPFDPSHFAVPTTVTGAFDVVKQLVTCPVRKPNRREFVRIHPEFSLRVFILELKEERETYLVEPSVVAGLSDETRIVTLHLAVNPQGAIFLWPVPEPRLDGKENDWWTSTRIAAQRARTVWIRMVANMSLGAYDVFVAAGALGNPIWPDQTMAEILQVAFGDRYIIWDLDHPVVRRLRGLE